MSGEPMDVIVGAVFAVGGIVGIILMMFGGRADR